MATPNNDSTGAEDSVPAIAALFEAERYEVQSILGHVLSLISILVAYSAAASIIAYGGMLSCSASWPLRTRRRSGSTSTRWPSGLGRPTNRVPLCSGLSTVSGNEGD